MKKDTEKTFDARLVCFPQSLKYDFDTRTGQLFLHNGGCCDMTGCIKIFKAIDPQVSAITTYSDGKEDTSYRKDGSMWKSYEPGSDSAEGEIPDEAL